MSTVESSGRASPPTVRVVRVLDFLSRHPHERFGVSALAREIDLSKPTCLGIVTSLCEAGYLVRDERDKTYRLGPALIALGHTAQEAMRVSPAARQELRRLSSRFSTIAALSAVVDDRITLLELVAPAGMRVPVKVGQSYPFAPPVGLMFVLWDEEAVRTWLAKEPTIPLRTGTHRLHRVIAECRADGYLVERLTPGGQRLYTLMAGMSSHLPDELRALLGEMVSDIGERVYLRSESRAASGSRQRHDRQRHDRQRHDPQRHDPQRHDPQRHDISVISAPVYDHHHRQAMVVSLQIGRPLTDAEITERALQLVATADGLTAQLGGSKPTFG